MSLCSYHPSLRFILPMIGGIVYGHYFYHIEWVSFCLPVFFLLWGGLFISNRYGWVRCYGATVCLFFFSLGYALVCRQLEQVSLSFPDYPSCYQVLVDDIPVEKAKSIQCRVVLEGVWKEDGTWHPELRKPHLLCYIAKDSTRAFPLRGDRLWVHTQFRLPAANHLPDAFDYARFLLHHGISGTAYVSAHHWKKVHHVEERTLKQQALDGRSHVLELYRRLGFSGDEFSVLSALTVGDKESLDEEILQTYSVSGASHVLALSGLHVGFIYGLLFFLLAPLWMRWYSLKLPLSLFIIFSLWLFAFFTGLSVSVVRAVIMCTLHVLFSFRTEPTDSFDVLLTTAFLMLVYQPLWLFDVGFQLSFTAVASILLIYPKLAGLFQIRSSLLRKLWGLIAVSLSAQVGTAPLVIFYFSHFSTHFLLTNLWVIPLVSLVMYASFFMLLLTPFPVCQQFFSEVVQWLIRWQNAGLRWIEHLPFSSLDTIQLDIWEIGWIYLCLYLLYRCIVKQQASRVLAFLSVLLVGLIGQLVSTFYYVPQEGIVFYKSQGKLAVQCLTNGSRSWMVGADSIPDSLAWNRTLKSYWNRYHLETPQWVTGYCHTKELVVQEQLVFYKDKCICLLSDHRWRNKISAHPLLVDYLCITREYRGDLKDISAVFQLHTVILDSSVSTYYQKRIQQDCRDLGLTLVVLPEQSLLAYHW